MSAPEPMRPASRGEAVRPHSASFLPPPPTSRSPRPAGAASCCSTSLFFVPAPRPGGKQSICVAVPCSHLGWEHGRAWEQFREQEKTVCPIAYANVPTVPSFGRARVMRSRARAHVYHAFCLGTWEQSQFSSQNQWLVLFPSLFPTPLRVGTWEHFNASGFSSNRLGAVANKLEGANGAQRLAGGDARQNFRARIAAGGDLVEIDLRRIRELAPRRSGNGGNRPFRERLAGQVGRLVLEGGAQDADPPSIFAPRPKLGRLRDLGQAGAIAADGQTRAPRAPNRARTASALLALHAGQISFELRSGLIRDRFDPAAGKGAQTHDRRRGRGGAGASIAAETAERSRNRGAGGRAGVKPPAASAWSHETGEYARLRRDRSAVNGVGEVSCG